MTVHTEQTREVVHAFFARLTDTFYGRDTTGDTRDLASFFAERVRWDIPGDTATVPWIGRRSTRAEVAEFFTGFGTYINGERFAVDRIVADGTDAVALGDLRSRVRATGRLIESPFAVHLTVHDGLITRYVLYEDSWRVAEATRLVLRATPGAGTT